MVPGGGTCLPSFPPPSPRHPGSGAARAEYALLPPSSVHPPIHRSLTRESVGSAASEIFSVGKLSVCWARPGKPPSVENLSAADSGCSARDTIANRSSSTLLTPCIRLSRKTTSTLIGGRVSFGADKFAWTRNQRNTNDIQRLCPIQII